MKRLSSHIFLLLFFLSFFSGAARADETTLHTASDQTPEATLIFSTSPLVTMKEIPFRLVLETSSTSADIQSAGCSLTMPEMPMPDNNPDLDCRGRICTGKAVFTMAGRWRATFGLIMKDGHHATLAFDIAMVEIK